METSQGESIAGQTEFTPVRGEVLTQMLESCDVAYDGISSHSAINFNPSFGKISMGEHFRCLFTIQNKNQNYDIEELRVKTTLEKVPKQKDAHRKDDVTVLMEVKLNRLGPRE